jgi:hypothetical protein
MITTLADFTKSSDFKAMSDQPQQEPDYFSTTTKLSGSSYRAHLYNQLLEKQTEGCVGGKPPATPRIGVRVKMAWKKTDKKETTVSATTAVTSQSPILDAPAVSPVSPRKLLVIASSKKKNTNSCSKTSESNIQLFLQIGEDTLSEFMEKQQSPIASMKFDPRLLHQPLNETIIQNKLSVLSFSQTLS